MYAEKCEFGGLSNTNFGCPILCAC